MEIVKVVAAVIKSINENGESVILATQRGYGEMKGGWEFPGGKIESGETPQEALCREIMEELDTEIIVGDLIQTIEYDYPSFHLSMDCFWCEIESGTPILKEHEAAKWLTKNQLSSVEWLPADKLLINEVIETWIYPFSFLVSVPNELADCMEDNHILITEAKKYCMKIDGLYKNGSQVSLNCKSRIAGVWALWGRARKCIFESYNIPLEQMKNINSKSDNDYGWVCLQVGQSVDIRKEILEDIDLLNKPIAYSTDYLNFRGENLFSHPSIHETRDWVHNDISRKIPTKAFVIVAKEIDKLKDRKEIESNYAKTMGAIYWR